MYNRPIDQIDKFLNLTTFGTLDTPIIKKTKQIELDAEIVPFNVAFGMPEREQQSIAIHFFIDDYQFLRLWKSPQTYIEKLKRFKFILAPDFSLYSDYPKAYQHFNHYRKHALAAYYQQNGVNVIPTLSWSDNSSFDWCFDGIERGSIVAVSSVGCMNNNKSKKLFIRGFIAAVDKIKPKQILFFGKIPDELMHYQNIIIQKETFTAKHDKIEVVS